MLKRILTAFLIVISLLNSAMAFGDFFDDFSDEQTGSWAPARWWYGEDHACRGKFIMPGNSSTMLDIAFSRAQRLQEISAAGGFVIEVDVLEIRGSAGICVGSKEYEKSGIAVVVHADEKTDADKLYINGQSFDITGDFKPGQKIRIEIDTKDFEKDTDAFISVYFGKDLVVREHKFNWEKSPLGFFLMAIGNRAVFDNLRITTAQTRIEFAGWDVSPKASTPAVDVKIRLKNPQPDWDYTVDLAVTGGSAVQGKDYIFKDQKLTFNEGQTSKTVTIDFITDRQFDAGKTIELSLVNPFGGNAVLGGERTLVYTIKGKYPIVQFVDQTCRLPENEGGGKIRLELSHKCDETVTVNYKVSGGTAQKGKDYNLKDGRISFRPGEILKEIELTPLDDSDSENSIDETVLVQLVDPENCVIGDKNVAVFEITDNEPWIEFDGSKWICGFDKHHKINGQNVLSVNENGHLEWVSTYGDILYATLEPQSLTKVGDVVEYGWLYKGDGQGVGSYVENICERYGSGDLRLSMLDLNGKSMSLDKQYTRNDEVFCGSKGYQARLSPHVPIDQRSDKWAIRVNPSGGNCNSPVDWGGCWAFPTYFNGHGVAVGEFSPMIIKLERTAEDTIEFSVTLNNEKHTLVDKDKSSLASNKDKMESLYGEGSYNVVVVPGYQPKNIDTMALYFANQRPFDLITLAPIEK